MSVRLLVKEVLKIPLSDAIPELKTPDQFNRLLDQSISVSISWGKRMMRVGSCTGEIEIPTLIRQFFEQAPIVDCISLSLKERLAWYDLWGAVDRIYQRSEKELRTTWGKYYVPALEGRAASQAGDSVAMLKCYDVRNNFLRFSREEITKIWPHKADEYHEAFWGKPRMLYVTRDLLAEACRSKTPAL